MTVDSKEKMYFTLLYFLIKSVSSSKFFMKHRKRIICSDQLKNENLENQLRVTYSESVGNWLVTETIRPPNTFHFPEYKIKSTFIFEFQKKKIKII